MIGLYCSWSERSLAPPLADRFVSSLTAGPLDETASMTRCGATLGCLVGNAAAAYSWTPPLPSSDEIVLFTGHIDNRTELLKSLGETIAPPGNDAELYGLCLSIWRDTCDLKIIGQYAAITFSPQTKRVRIARSPIQAPPLHIWQDKQRVIVASSVWPIFSTGEIACEVDEQKIADSLYLNYLEGQRGWFNGVSRLPLGTQGIIAQSGMHSKSYYDPFDKKTVRFTRDEDYVEAANSLFEEATQAALDGYSNPAISLSGGYDSQAVASYALAALPAGQVLQGYTSVPETEWDKRSNKGRFGDERAHVEAFADMHPRLQTNFIDASNLSFDHELDAFFLMTGAPPRNALNMHWIHEIRSLAKSTGCDVMLNGAFGNHTFSFAGSGAFPGWLAHGRWQTLVKELWAIRWKYPTVRHAAFSTTIRPFLPVSVSRQLNQLRTGKPASPFDSWCPLNADWAAKMAVPDRALAMGYDASFGAKKSTQETRRAMVSNSILEQGDISQGLEAIHGIQNRDPTSYRPLLEFCFNIPDNQYIRNGETRWLAKRMLAGYAPKMVIDERRRGQQAADWHLRLSRQTATLQKELDKLSSNHRFTEMLNIPRLQKTLDNWPKKTPIDPTDPNRHLPRALIMALTTARFIRFVEARTAQYEIRRSSML